jgi:lysozyme family protein
MMAAVNHGEANSVDILKQYLCRVDEIIGERTSEEQE